MEPWILIPVTAIFLLALFAGLREVVRRRVWCPREQVSAEIELVQRYQHPERPERVRSCSLLEGEVDCYQVCVR